MKSKLDVATNIAIIGVCVIAAFVLVRNNFFPATPPPPPGTVQVGEQLPALAKLVPAGAEKAMVMAIAPQCHFCNDSMPFYKQLRDKRDQSGSAIKLIAAVPSVPAQAKDEEAQHLASAGATPDGIQQVDYRDIKVNGTPTLILVDRQGKVLSVWVGKLEASGEQEVLQKL